MDRFGQFSRLLDKASTLQRPLAASARLHRSEAGLNTVARQTRALGARSAASAKFVANPELLQPDRPAAIGAGANLHHRIADAHTVAMGETMRRGFDLALNLPRGPGGDVAERPDGNSSVAAVAHRYDHGVMRAARSFASVRAHSLAHALANTAAIVQEQRLASRRNGRAKGPAANAGAGRSNIDARSSARATSAHRSARTGARAIAVVDGAALARAISALTSAAGTLPPGSRAPGRRTLARANSAIESGARSFASDSTLRRHHGQSVDGIHISRPIASGLRPVSRLGRMPDMSAMGRVTAALSPKTISNRVSAVVAAIPQPRTTPDFAPTRSGRAPVAIHLHMDSPRVTVNLTGGSNARISTGDEIGHAVEQALRKANGDLGHALVQTIARELARRKRTEF